MPVVLSVVWMVLAAPSVGPEIRITTNGMSNESWSQVTPAVAVSGNRYVVAWSDDRQQTFSRSVRVSAVTTGGIVLDPLGLHPEVTSVEQVDPALAFGGGVFWLGFSETPHHAYYFRQTKGLMLSSTLQTSGYAPDIVNGSQPHAVFDGTYFFVVARRFDSSHFNIVGQRFLPSGQAVDLNPVMICNASGHQERPRVAVSGLDFVVVWEDGRGANPDVYANRVERSTGNVRDGNGFALFTAAGNQTEPAIDCTATQCLVVARDTRVSPASAMATRLSGTTVLDPSGIRLSNVGPVTSRPAVVATANDFIAFWTETRGQSTLLSGQVSAAGVVSPTNGRVVAPSSDGQAAPAAARLGVSTLVAWEQRTPGFVSRVRFTFVDDNGVNAAGTSAPLTVAPREPLPLPHQRAPTGQCRIP